jgi:hypothetical protein
MSKAIDYIKAALQIAFTLIVFTIIVLNFSPLNHAFDNILEQAASISAVEFLGVKLTFSKEIENLNLDYDEAAYKKLGFKPEAYKTHLQELIHALGQEEILRLMYVGQLRNLCEFDNPTPEMRKQVAADYSLRSAGLISIINDPSTLEQVRRDFAAKSKLPDIGNPHACYNMDLTATGDNVKTVLVRTLNTHFVASVASK